MKISTFVDIQSTPELVFGWLARPERATQWMSSVSRTEILQETPGMVGTSFREVVEDEGGSMEMHGTVTSFEPPRSISFHLSSKVNVLDVSYRVEPTTNGVRVIEDSDIRWKFPVNIMSIFLGEKMKQGILAQLQAEFSRLKELCEAESVPATGA